MSFFKNLGKGIKRILSNVPNPLKFFKKPIQKLYNLQREGLATLTDNDRFYARFAEIMYIDYTTRGDIEGYKLIQKFNEPSRSVWYNTGNNQVVVSYRGTEDLEQDLLPDIAILTNTTRYIKRFEDDTQFYKKVIDEFPNANFVLVGHSLGGHIVAYILNEVKRGFGYTYNGGVGFGNADIYDNPRLRNLRTKIDPISLLASEYMVNVPQTVENAHGIENFL